jgi:hypothetical protein
MELRTDLVNQTSPSQVKIALFSSLFRGREDVYPRRFESRKTGKAGYSKRKPPEVVRAGGENNCARLSSKGARPTSSPNQRPQPCRIERPEGSALKMHTSSPSV